MIVVHGVGPVYWGVETEPSDRRVLTECWLVEDLPPYRKSIKAFRVRLGEHAIHIGLCRKHSTSPHQPLTGVSPSEIGRWGREVEEEGDGASPGVEV